MLCVAIDLEAWPDMLAAVEPYEDISISVGVHPSSSQTKLPDFDQVRTWAGNERVIAIGETGLDYHYLEGDADIEQQSFREHIRIGNELDLPVIVHTRDAREDTIKILEEENANQCGGVLHCFTENQLMANAGIDMGLMVSFSGIVTFKNAGDLRDVARQVPDDHLLIETDSPYLAPVPFRGKQNYPGHVPYVAQCLAELRGVSVDYIADLTRANFNRVFLKTDKT